MGKRKIRAKRKNLKKTVKHNVKKIKEKNSTTFTVQDLALNPALLYSPQFKALPMEKQFQLTSQLKQLKAMRMPMMFTGGNGSSGSDIYSKLNESNRKVQDTQNETQKITDQLRANTETMKQLLKLRQDVKNAENQKIEETKKELEKESLEKRLAKAQNEENDLEINNLKQQIKELESKHEIAELSRNQKELEELKSREKVLKQNISSVEKPILTPNRHRKHFQKTEGESRILSERMQEKRNEKNEKQEKLVNSMVALDENGEIQKSEQMEKKLREEDNEIDNEIAEIPFDMPKPNFSPETDSSFENVDEIPSTGRFNKKKTRK